MLSCWERIRESLGLSGIAKQEFQELEGLAAIGIRSFTTI